MQALLVRIHRAGRTPLHHLSAVQARVAYEAAAEILDLPRAPLARVDNLDVNGLPARLYVASVAPAMPVLLYLHGGGFTIGSLETHDSLCRQLALRSGGAVLSLGYRLAPEHRFPAAFDDTWQALQWLKANAASLGLDGRRIAIGGDSAGATLAAATALRARDEGLPLALQLLVTPGTDALADTTSRREYAHGFLLDAEAIDWFFSHTIAHDQRGDPRFSPLRADDLSDVAPACVIIAECDPLADEGLAYADRLRAAGVAVNLELACGVTHDFIKMGRALPEAAVAQQFAADALKHAWSNDA
jgi:acetyl esterase